MFCHRAREEYNLTSGKFSRQKYSSDLIDYDEKSEEIDNQFILFVMNSKQWPIECIFLKFDILGTELWMTS